MANIRDSFKSIRRSIRPSLVTRSLGCISIKSGSDSLTPSDFLYELKGARKAGFEEVEIDVTNFTSRGVYPNVAVPICALMEVSKERTEFLPVGSNAYIDHLGFFQPYIVDAQLAHQRNVLNKIWEFQTSEETFRLTREFIDELRQTIVIEAEGVLVALEWCLGEVLENVVLHSNSGKGFVMGQVHPSKNHVAFSVVDLGQGIFNSLSSSDRYQPRGPVDAITLAMQEGVTRDKDTNQGNGLWGLHNIMRENKGVLAIISGGGGVKMSASNNVTFKTQQYGFDGGGTIIDFQFDLKSPISLGKVLGGYIPKSLAVINSEDDRGDIHFLLKDEKSGFGTREAGVRIRNEILNLRAQTTGRITIDFEGIPVITSSFADELIGKLYAEMGPLNFGKIIELVNMSETINIIIDRAIRQRLGSS